MGRRTLKASAEGIKLIKAVMKQRSLTQDFLAGSAGCSRQTIGKLLKGDPVDEDTLNAVCGELKLGVEEVAALEKSPEPEVDLDDRVNNIRNKIAPQVKQECGTMRVLDMVQEIGLGEIYTDVNILESLTSNLYVPSLAEWNEQFFNALGEFDRLGWGRTEERVSGLQAVTENTKLMIWGKPGAGKTTFLKHIAISAMAGQLATNSIPIFLSLKEVAEQREALLVQIQQKFIDYQVSAADIKPLIEQGRCLLLLDGLDEVLEKDSSNIIGQIQTVADHPQYGQNKILVTCRIAAKEYLFKGFRDVEVADFNWEQIECFVRKWFTVHDVKGKKAEKFMAKLKEDTPIRELASSPLLLTLLCLIFGEINDFRRNRAELYEEGVDILLKKWDGKRGIERNQIYRQLSPKRKKDLLSLIASETFNRGNIFFRQKIAESLIEGFIQNLPEAANDPEALRLDSEQVLKAIEAQHGLLVARAKGVYSFSHLTFQEYFIARKIALRPSSETLQMLASQVKEKKWREIILLTVEQLDDATELVMDIKQTIDNMVANDEKIQTYLKWLLEKVDSLSGQYILHSAG